jgi:hypothetical protein
VAQALDGCAGVDGEAGQGRGRSLKPVDHCRPLRRPDNGGAATPVHDRSRQAQRSEPGHDQSGQPTSSSHRRHACLGRPPLGPLNDLFAQGTIKLGEGGECFAGRRSRAEGDKRTDKSRAYRQAAVGRHMNCQLRARLMLRSKSLRCRRTDARTV